MGVITIQNKFKKCRMKKSIYLTTVVLTLILGCTKKEELKKAPEPVNSFLMEIDGQLWEPSVINNDECYVAYSCELSYINNRPFYTIKAYKDSQSRTNSESENIFRLQIMDVANVETYSISEPFGTFNSYARLVLNEDGLQKIYENSTTASHSYVEITEMLPVEGSVFIGIKGTFSGKLFNLDNPDDFIIIENCLFTFNKINRNNFCQCEE
jgi:hypothetical protein